MNHSKGPYEERVPKQDIFAYTPKLRKAKPNNAEMICSNLKSNPTSASKTLPRPNLELQRNYLPPSTIQRICSVIGTVALDTLLGSKSVASICGRISNIPWRSHLATERIDRSREARWTL